MARLILRIRRRPPAAEFEALLRPHLGLLYRLAFRFTGSRDDAEDLVQELCTRIYPRLAELKKLDRPQQWLARVLHNLYIDQVRRQMRSPLDVVEELPEVESETPGPERLAMAELTVERLQRVLLRMPPEQRAVIAWHDMEGYTLEELSESQGLPLGTLKSRLHRARAALRQGLMEPLANPRRVSK